MRSRALVGILFCLLLGGLWAGVSAASAYREPRKHPEEQQPENWLFAEELARLPFSTEGQIEGACGLAVAPSGSLLISDYYHRFVHTFSGFGLYEGSQSLAGGDPHAGINKLNSVCGLAVDGAGTIYANELHQRVLRLPGEEVIDPGPSTGVAVDGAGNVYVDDRNYVAVYDAPVSPGKPATEKIGTSGLGDGYGIAVDSKTGRIYVPDASDETVKVLKRGAGAPVDTIAAPAGKLSFNSLFNASVAVDNSGGEGDGHLLVVDDLKPLFERPEAAVYEFDSAGSYLDRLQVRSVGPVGVEKPGPIFGEPSGIAVDSNTGDLFVTTGNSEQSNVVAYGPYEATAPVPPAASPPGGEGSSAPGAALAARSHTPASPSSGVDRKGGSEAVIVRRGPVQVSFNGKLAPNRLPRHGSAPVGITIDARIAATGNGSPPQLRRIAIAINRNGHFVSKGLPACRVDQIQPSTTSGALAACGPSLVGEGHFSADVKLPEQSPFPSEGKVLAFNGRVNGRPAILAHIYGTQPAPTSAVLPFLLGDGHGTYGTTLEASLPQATGSWGYVTGLTMNLRRRFSYRGKARSFLSAGCPAAPGFPSAVFPLARTSFVFAGGPTLVSVLNRTCTAKG